MDSDPAAAVSPNNAETVSRNQLRTVVLIALTVVLDGIDGNVLALSIPALASAWRLPPGAFASLIAVGTVAMMVGSIAAGIVSDRWGRRPTLVLATALYGFAGLAGGLVSDLLSLGVTRALAGVGLGAALTTAVLSVAEHLPASVRTTAVSLVVLGIPLGGILSGLLAAVVIEPLGWRALYIITGIAPLLLALAYVWLLPETPAFLSGISRKSRSPGREGRVRAAHFGTLLAPELRGDTLLVWTGFFASLLASYMMLGWLPSLLVQSGASSASASASISYASLGSFMGAICTPLLVYRLGSRLSMMGAAFLAASGALALAVLFNGTRLPLVFSGLAVMMAGFGALNSVVYALLPNIYPPAIRGLGIGIAMAVGRLGAVLSAYVGAFSMANGSMSFFLLIVASGLVALISFACVRRHAPSSRSAPIPA